MFTRRGLIGGGLVLLAAPAIVRCTSLMAIKPFPAFEFDHGFKPGDLVDMTPSRTGPFHGVYRVTAVARRTVELEDGTTLHF